MNSKYKKITSLVLLVITSVVVFSCYEKFDPESYNPPFTINGFTSSEEIAATEMVAYWPFDGTLTETISNTTGAATGTTFVTGFKGQALKGALNSYALADPSSSIINLSSFTISFWVNTPPPSTGIIGLFSLAKTDAFWGNLEIFVENGSTNTNGKLRTHIFNGTADKTFASDNVLNLFDAWVQMTITYDAVTSTYRLYANGTKVSTVTVASTGAIDVTNQGKIVFGTVQFMTTPSQTSSTGSQPWASYLTGMLDEVRIYNRILTDTEVYSLVVLQGKGK